MKYMQPIFTCPTSENVSQFKWDLAFLSKIEFIIKYEISNSVYDAITNSSGVGSWKS